MAKVLEFPIALSETDKKLIRLESYIKSNLIDLAKKRKDLDGLRKEVDKFLRRSKLSVVKNEQPDGK